MTPRTSSQFERPHGKRRTVIGPVHHIFSRIDAPLPHPEKIGMVLIVSRVNIQGAIVHHRCRIRSIASQQSDLCACNTPVSNRDKPLSYISGYRINHIQALHIHGIKFNKAVFTFRSSLLNKSKGKDIRLISEVTMLHSPFSMLQTCPIWHKVPKLLLFIRLYILFELFLCT